MSTVGKIQSVILVNANNTPVSLSGGGGGGVSATASNSAPTYIEGASSALSMTLKGGLRTVLTTSTGALVDYADPGQAPMAGSLPVAVALEHSPAHDNVAGSNPIQNGLESRTTVATAVGDGDMVRQRGDTEGRSINKPYSAAELDWTYAGPTSGIVSSTADVVIKAAAATGVINYLTSIQIAADTLSANTEVVVKNGATVIWRTKLQTGPTNPFIVNFPTPLKSSAATALNFAVITSVTGGIYVNAQGYIGR